VAAPEARAVVVPALAVPALVDEAPLPPGVDRNGPAPPALPEGVRPASRPPVEVDRRLVERHVAGELPRIARNGARPLDTYAAAVVPGEGADEHAAGGAGHAAGAARPSIALLVTGLGLDHETTGRVVALPAAVALGFSPYVSGVPAWQRFMRWHGHETLTTLPLRAIDPQRDDRGALAIDETLPPPDMRRALLDVLARGSGYVAAAGQAGAFAAEPERFTPVAAELAGRGVGFVELDGGHLRGVAARTGLAYLAAPLALDADLRPERIDAALRALEEEARAQGTAVGYTRPVPLVLDRLWTWARTLDERGFALVPPSALMQPAGAS